MGVGTLDLYTSVFPIQLKEVKHYGVRYISSWENRRSQAPIYNYDVVAYQNVNTYVLHLILTRKSLTIHTKVFLHNCYVFDQYAVFIIFIKKLL